MIYAICIRRMLLAFLGVLIVVRYDIPFSIIPVFHSSVHSTFGIRIPEVETSSLDSTFPLGSLIARTSALHLAHAVPLPLESVRSWCIHLPLRINPASGRESRLRDCAVLHGHHYSYICLLAQSPTACMVVWTSFDGATTEEGCAECQPGQQFGSMTSIIRKHCDV